MRQLPAVLLGRRYRRLSRDSLTLAMGPVYIVGVTITLLYFAAIREIVGHPEETLLVPPEVTTIGALAAHLEKTVPALAGRLGAVRWANNETFSDFDSPLEDGDVVALIPPVAGGSR